MKKHEFPFLYEKIGDEDLILWCFYIGHDLLLFRKKKLKVFITLQAFSVIYLFSYHNFTTICTKDVIIKINRFWNYKTRLDNYFIPSDESNMQSYIYSAREKVEKLL